MIKKDVMSDEVLVKVEGVSKKFCKSLKRSMLYGVSDTVRETIGLLPPTGRLRKDEFWAVDDVSFEVRRGECLGLIGPNGAGKSTLLKILSGIMLPDKGVVEIHGKVRALIELGAGFHPMLTGRENIYLSGSILGLSRKKIDSRFKSIVEFAELEGFIDTPVKFYSSGMYVRLGFSIAAHLDPDVMLIDEVLAVGDIGFRAKCINAIFKIMKNTAVIFVSHRMPEVARICSHIMMMNQGRVKFKGKDVAKGIGLFHSHFEVQRKIFAGSGMGVIHNVELESNGQKRIESIKYLDELLVHIHATIAPSVKYPSVSVAFFDQEHRLIAQAESLLNGYQIYNSGEKMHIVLRIAQMNFNPGVYSLGVGITADDREEVLVKCEQVKKIRIVGDSIGYAPIQFFGEWTLR